MVLLQLGVSLMGFSGSQLLKKFGMQFNIVYVSHVWNQIGNSSPLWNHGTKRNTFLLLL